MLNSTISKPGRGWARPRLLLALALLCTLFLALLIKAMAVALEIPTFHLDGAFQTASGLFRLSEGQLPGRDFFTYLGVGVLGVLYPLFALLGDNIASSVTTTYFASFVSLFLSTYVVFRLMDPSASRFWAFLIAALAIASVLIPIVEIPILKERALPGNSLRPLRAFLPYAAVFAMVSLLQSKLPILGKLCFIAVLAAICFSWSNDYALPSATVVLFGLVCWMVCCGEFSWPRLALTAGVFVLGVCIVLVLSSSGHPIDVLGYSFQDVRRDQYWYFGPWNPSARIFGIGDLWTKLLPDFGWTLVFIPIVAGVAAYTRRFELFCLALVGLAGFLGGAIATVGGHLDTYHAAFHYWVFLVFWAGLWALVRSALRANAARDGAQLSAQLDIADRVVRAAAAVLVVYFFFNNLIEYQTVKRRLEDDPKRYFEPALGGYLTTDWQHYIALAKASRERSTQEEYWGLWSAITRDFSPRVDSVIHALGGVREEFFANSDIVTTTRGSVSLWQQWSFSANYWFYRRLLTDYQVVDFSPMTLVWEKRSVAAEIGPPQSCEVSRADNFFRLPGAREGVYEVALTVDMSLVPSRGLVMVKNNLNSIDTADGFLSLDTSRDNHVVPVRVTAENELFALGRLDESGNPRPSGLLQTCTFSALPFIAADALITGGAQYQPYPLTDKYWTRGIANFDTAFFVDNTPGNRRVYQADAVVEFADGEARRIREVTMSKRYINVYLEGAALDPGKYGYPARFTVK